MKRRPPYDPDASRRAAEAQAQRLGVYLLAVELLEAAASAPTPASAAAAARAIAPLALAELDAEGRADVAGVVAFLAVWSLPPSLEPVRSAWQVRLRLAQVASWVKKARGDLSCQLHEAMWRTS